MIQIIPFEAKHMKFMFENGLQDPLLKSHWTEKAMEYVEGLGVCYTVIARGVPVLCGGILEHWENRGEAWLVFGMPKTEDFIFLYRAVDRFLKASKLRRIEMVVDFNFDAGHRWARLLGFKKEADRLVAYRPNGGDVSLYGMVRG